MSRRRAQAAARIDEPIKPLHELLDELERLDAEAHEAMQTLVRELRPIAMASRERTERTEEDAPVSTEDGAFDPQTEITDVPTAAAPVPTPAPSGQFEQLDLLAPRFAASPASAPAPSASPRPAPATKAEPALPTRAIADDVLRVLTACVVDGSHVLIPGGLENPLPRDLYTRVDEVLRALGGKWNRKARAHVFAESPADVLDAAITSGRIVLPKDLGWFPTPDALAREIVARADVRPGMGAIEPSAGEGAIVRALHDAGAWVHAWEIDPKRAEVLRGIGCAEVNERDFLTDVRVPLFDRAVMNPPFGKRADVAHVRHAFSMLRPGGRLVAIMSAGVQFRQDRECAAFRELVSASRGSIEALPEGSFVESGTGVRTVLVEMWRAA